MTGHASDAALDALSTTYSDDLDNRRAEESDFAYQLYDWR